MENKSVQYGVLCVDTKDKHYICYGISRGKYGVVKRGRLNFSSPEEKTKILEEIDHKIHLSAE